MTAYTVGSGIAATAQATKRIADQNYSTGYAYQWLVEYIRNYEQARDRQKRQTGKERFVQDFVGLKVDGKEVVKIRMWNTAIPMSMDEMQEYLLKFGEGADARWTLGSADGSYGQGATSSTMAWNPEGIVAIAVDPKDKTAMGMVRVDTGDIIAPLMLEHPTEVDLDGDAELAPIVPILSGVSYAGLDLHSAIPTDVWMTGGMVFILMGIDRDRPNVLGDPNRAEKMRTAVDVVNERLYDPASKVTVSYLAEVNAAEKAGLGKSGGGQRFNIDGKTYKVDNRTLKGYVEWAKRPVAKHLGDVVLDSHGTTVQVHLLDEDWNLKPTSKAMFNKLTREKAAWDALSPAERKRLKLSTPTAVVELKGKYYTKALPDQWYPHDGKGYIGYRYKNEVINGIPTQNLTQQMSDWGIPYRDVAERVGLLVTPPRASDVLTGAWGVMQNNSRSQLVDHKGNPLNYLAWGNAFMDQMERFPELVEAIEEARKRLMETLPDRSGASQRLLSRIKSRLLHKTLVVDPKGTVDMDPSEEDVPGRGGRGGGGGGGGGGNKPTKQGEPPADKDNPLAKGYIKRSTSLPDVVWLPKLDGSVTWESMDLPKQGADGEQFAGLKRDADGLIIFLNREHNVYREQVTYYTGEWLSKRPKMRSLAHEVVKKIEDAYDELARSIVIHVIAECKNTQTVVDMLSPKDWESRFPGLPNPLSAALHGFINVDQIIATSIGGSKMGLGREAAA